MNPLFDLTGRVALVTGGSKGLGKAMARGFAEAGASVVISSRHGDELTAAAQEIEQGLDVQVKTMVADMTRRDDVRRLADEASAAFGRVDVLVNNAGTNRPQPLTDIEDDVWDEVLELNLTSCMRLSRALTPGMKERRWGRIIYLSSIMGFASKEERSSYSATKSALIGMAKAQALELGAFGITVNCLAPGPFLTDLPARVLSEEQRQAVAVRTSVGRWASPRELVGPALLLATEAGSYVNGATLLVDGGLLCRAF